MTNEEKLKVFEKHLNMIVTKSIKEFTEFALVNSPEYFWTLMASTSGRRHGKNETLIDHVQGCLQIAEKVIEQFNGHWTDKQNSQLLSSLLLHDCWRCGEPGNECRFTQEDIDERKCPQEFLGKLKTSSDHPEVGYNQLLSLSAEFNLNAMSNKTELIGAKNLQPILKGVRYHYGIWTKTNLKNPFSLSFPFDSIIMQVHNVDYMQCITAKLYGR